MESELFTVIRCVRRLYVHMLTSCGKDSGLTQPEIDVLLYLASNPDKNTARDIVLQRGLAKSNVSTAVESLRQKGYLSVSEDPQSRRVRRLCMMPAAKEIAVRLQEEQRRFFDILAQDFTEEENNTLHMLLRRTGENARRAFENESEPEQQ